MMKLLVVLQCKWGTTAERRSQLRDKQVWLSGLWQAHTGRRLLEIIPEGWEVDVVNASPKIGKTADAAFPPDSHYIQEAIDNFSPHLILGCGRVAQRGLNSLGITYLSAPHPAYWRLSKIRTRQIRARLRRLAQVKVVTPEELDVELVGEES